MRPFLCTFILLVPPLSAFAETLPEAQISFLRNHCLDCHNAETQQAEINLDISAVDWSRRDALLRWERILDALASAQMPPPDAVEPAGDERGAMVDWIDQSLTMHTPVGGTLARRLNQAEYKASVESILGLKNFVLPQGFPSDREHHGFDNLGEGLVLSPPLLEAYTETARLVADEIFPPARTAAEPATQYAAAKDLVISYSSSKIVDGAMRLGMKCDPIQRSCTWPSRIEVTTSGLYSVLVELSTFAPGDGGEPMIVKVFARDVASPDGVSHKTLRLLKTIDVSSESPESVQFDAELYQGQTIVLHWANATLDSDRGDKAELQEFFRKKDHANPQYLAAWHAMLHGEKGQGFRGGIGWERVKSQLAREDLPAITEKEKEALLKKIAGNPVLYAETVVFDVFENGPALEIHGLTLEGPHELVDGPLEIQRRRLRNNFTGDAPNHEVVIRRFLANAFRRPVGDTTVETFVEIYNRHLEHGHTEDEAMHLVIRSALISPRFLYRCLTDGPLDNYDLATRLAYFLTGAPPDSGLIAKADAGTLTTSQVLRSEAQRLIPRSPDAPLVKNFTGQWLDTRKLADIMPDPKFKFLPSDERNARLEVEYFFAEMIRENRPMTDFIDPDFTWTSARVAKNVYALKTGFNKKKSNAIHRVRLPRGGHHGGVLGQAAVMMATANGVDTQPVLRGVWVLENVLGTPTPPPPKAVPPITPDTSGAKTPRELLAAHTKEVSCAGCHRKIDPVGFALENFDPVGRWRDEWPGIDEPIDASSTLPDGTRINDVVDLKAWLIENIDQFSECLAEKLMTYATGRVPNYSERKEIAAIVNENRRTGNGFRDLILALIESDTFRTK